MVTFNFSNVSGNTSGQRRILSTTTPSTTPSGMTIPGNITFITTTQGTNPIVFTSNLTGQGLPGDTMRFIVTATTPQYQMRFSDANDRLELRTSGGISLLEGVYTLRFDAGSGLTRLSNISLNGGAGIGTSVTLLTESGASFVGTGAGTFAGEFTGIRFTVFAGGNLNSITGTPTCFAKGTRIATPDGETKVETLQLGDTVLTHDGGKTKVLWVGQQTFDIKGGLPDHLQIVRIKTGALGNKAPKRDLCVTADHAVLLNGALVNAGTLVNGDTINFEPVSALGQRVTVYHVETQSHELLLAEGLAAESFSDARQRQHFDNYDEYLEIFGAERIIPHMDVPRVSSQRQMPGTLTSRADVADQDRRTG